MNNIKNNNEIKQYIDLVLNDKDNHLVYEGKYLSIRDIDDQKFFYHSQLFYLMEIKEHPDIIINYIYINLYELINETYQIKKVLYSTLHSIYKLYYDSIICNQSDRKWFYSLFPLSVNYFSLKSFYVGLVGRVITCSFNPMDSSNLAFYWYGDPMDWSIGYHLYINSKNELEINKCKFIVTEELKRNNYNVDLLNRYGLSWSDNVCIIYKFSDPSPVVYLDAICSDDDDNFDFNFISCNMIKYVKQELKEDCVSNSLKLDSISEDDFNEYLIKYKGNINRDSELSEETKITSDKKRFNACNIDYDSCSFTDYDTCGIDEYDKEIRHLGYNEKLGSFWSSFKLIAELVEKREINIRLKKRLHLIKK